MNKKILVTRSSMPGMDEYVQEIRSLWDTHWITNMGQKHIELQNALKKYLNVDNVELLVNGHMALEMTLQAMNLQGEVITTPFTFASTTHAIVRNGLEPVFCDIDPVTYTMDATKIEDLITDRTCAIMPVHVYGNICDIDGIHRIAHKYELKVIYDAAHAFGETYKGESVGSFGDASCFSFHATKVYNTVEGGALVCHDGQTKQRIDYLKNFGFAGETTVIAPGINGKMDEVRAAYGLLNLKQVDAAIEARRQVAVRYREELKDVPGIRVMEDMPGVRHNYSYFPIFVNAERYGMTRDELYTRMKERNVLGRRYFYPLISEFSTYRGLESARPENLPVAHKVADSVICLPMYSGLEREEAERVLDCIVK